jgi:hypothetical protein
MRLVVGAEDGDGDETMGVEPGGEEKLLCFVNIHVTERRDMVKPRAQRSPTSACVGDRRGCTSKEA